MSHNSKMAKMFWGDIIVC